MIEEVQGRFRSKLTRAEIEELLQKDMLNLSDDEKEVLRLILAEMEDDNQELVGALTGAEFKRMPCDIRTFINDPYYLGNTCDNLYPRLQEDLVTLFEGGFTEAVLTGSIGWGKCVAGDTEVFDVAAGRRRRADEIGSFEVLSMTDRGKLEHRQATAFASGRKPCVRLRLAAGQAIVLSTDHPVFTGRGWVEAGKLNTHDLVATPRLIPAPPKPLAVSDEEVKLLAYLMADGGCTASITFTNETPAVLREFAEVIDACGDSTKYDRFHQHITPGVTPTKWQNSGKATSLSVAGVKWLVREWGIASKAKEKRLPAQFYGMSDDQIALFLNRFWACDGSLTATPPLMLETTLASEKLVDDLQFLLLRLGVMSRKYAKTKGYRLPDGTKKTFPAWCLRVTSSNIQRLLEKTGPILGKEEVSRAVLDWSVRANTNVDVVPVGLGELREIRDELGSSGAGLTQRYGCPEGQLLSRARFDFLCERERYHGKHAWLASTDLAWERIKSLEFVGEKAVFDLSVDETHSFVGNGIVVHNTFFASIGICRLLYELSCMHDPHKSFGIAKNSNISIVNLSVSEELATKVVFENIANKIKASPYFQEHFPFEVTKKELRFPGNIWIASRASTDTSVLGLNVIGGIIDETNFMAKKQQQKASGVRWGHYDQADALYSAMKRRMKSRFERGGKLPGLLFLVSSKKTVHDFTAKRIRESKTDPTVFVRDYALWDVKPGAFTHGRFFVFVGNETTPSRILDPGEEKKYDRNLPEGAAIIEVPEDFRHDFENDLEGAIRDIAGVATVAVHPFINRREKIVEAIDTRRKHPFTTEVYDSSRPGQFVWREMVRPTVERWSGQTTNRLRPIINPQAIRHVHIDPSLRWDSTGVCMAHISGWKEVVRRAEDGREYIEKAPVYYVDLVLKVVPPIGGEIIFGDLRRIVYELTEHGYSISMVTMDSWNSPDMLQQLASKGYRTEVLSVDKKLAPYENLKEALYENRVHLYQYNTLIKELRELEKNELKRKVDHPVKGSKDVSDAVAGCLYTLAQHRVAQPVPIMRGIGYIPDQDEAWMPEQREMIPAGESMPLGGGAGSSYGAGLSRGPMPFLSGSLANHAGLGLGGGGGGDDWGGGWNPGSL